MPLSPPEDLAAAIAVLVAAGVTTRAAQARRLGIGRSTLSRQLQAAGLAARQMSHSHWIPWVVSNAHTQRLEYQYLALLSGAAQGGPTRYKAKLRSAFAWADRLIAEQRDYSYSSADGWIEVEANVSDPKRWRIMALREAAVRGLIESDPNPNT